MTLSKCKKCGNEFNKVGLITVCKDCYYKNKKKYKPKLKTTIIKLKKKNVIKKNPLKFQFSNEIRNIMLPNICWSCGEPGADCIHHINGRVSDSILNAAPLHNFKCHIGKPLMNKETKSKFISKTLRFMQENNIELSKKDILYLKKYYK